jgi:neutral ceramidase
MSGRRLRNTIRASIHQTSLNPNSEKSDLKLNNLKPLSDHFIRDILGGDGNKGQPEKIIVNGLTNAYSSYVTTFEEYSVQRYEGASTIYGPHTLDAYLQQFARLTNAILHNSDVPRGPLPPNLLSKQISLNPGVIFDLPLFGKNFGSVLNDAKDVYKQGETVTVSFVAGNPRNNLQTEKSFLYVEQQSSGNWTVIADDGAIETRFIWKKHNFILGQSTVRIEWDTNTNYEPGNYRIRHSGFFKQISQKIDPYEGISRTFKLIK